MEKEQDKIKYYRPYCKGVYQHKGPNDIGKKSIPKNDRCEGFDDLWNKTFEEVMKYWDWVPVKSIEDIIHK